MREIDCSHGEGGGQLARTTIAAAALTHTPVRLIQVRATRSKSGLAARHLAAVRAVAELCGASGADIPLGATAFDFLPGVLRAGRFYWDVGTAGSVTLVLQAALPLAILCGGAVQMCITGGTDVRAAPPLDYFLQVFLPLLACTGVTVKATVPRRGYYPRGGGTSTFCVRALTSHARTTLWLRAQLLPVQYRQTQDGPFVGVELRCARKVQASW